MSTRKITEGLANAIANAMKDSFVNAVAAVYDGTQPTTASAAENGTLLGYITKDGAAFVSGQPDNGLNWEDAIDGVCAKPTDEEWAIIPIANGTARYVRIYENTVVTGISTTAKRMDLSCGITTGDGLWTPTNYLTEGIKQVVQSFNLRAPLT